MVLSPSHHLSERSALSSDNTKLLVFETTTEGGFGNKLKLEEGAMLELGRYEHRPRDEQSPAPGSSGDELEKVASEVSTPADLSTADITAASSRPTKSGLFTGFHIRKRSGQSRNVAGPALAVVDAEVTDHGDDKPKEAKDEEPEVGVKVMITLAALDKEEKPFKVRNEQTTYLHIVRFGRPPMVIEGEEPEEDNRPWVVKVVKREAAVSVL